jgi:uncharacterized membrane protein
MTAAPVVARLPGIDTARGVALIGMFVYHLTWDLSHFGFVAADLPLSPGWKAFAHVVAGSFLALVGISLVLAHRSAWDRAFWVRLARIGGAAAAISLVTYLILPDAFIFFGILHCIVVSSLLALPLLNAPLALVLLLALATLAAPHLLAGASGDHPALLWLGLTTSVPSSVDYQPILPWFGMVLIGVSLGRLIGLRPPAFLLLSPQHAPGRLLQFGGRHSLLVYLAHQPIFFGLVFLLAQAMGVHPNEEPDDAGFAQACETQCRQSGGTETVCQQFCACVVSGLRQANLWSQALSDGADAAVQERLVPIARRCSGLPP